MKTLAVCENVVSVGKEVGERLEKHNMSIQLVKGYPVQEVFTKEFLAKLGENYNTETMFLQFAVLTWGK